MGFSLTLIIIGLLIGFLSFQFIGAFIGLLLAISLGIVIQSKYSIQ